MFTARQKPLALKEKEKEELQQILNRHRLTKVLCQRFHFI